MKKTKYENNNRTKMWWTSECQKAVKTYHKAENQYLKNHIMKNLINMKKEQAKKRHIIKNAKWICFQRYASQINSRTSYQEVFRKMKALRGAQTNRRAIVIVIDNEVVYDEKRIGDAMVSNFSSVTSLDNFTEEFVYNMVQSELQDIDFSSTNEEHYNCSITPEELEAAL